MALDFKAAQERYVIHKSEAIKLQMSKDSNIRIYDIKDETRGNKNYYVIGLQKEILTPHEAQFLKYLLESKTGAVADDGCDSIVRLKSGELVIFRDTSSDIIRKFLDDNTEYPYLISFKIAKTHHYMSVIEKETGISYEFGVAPKTYNSFFSTPYIRNDTIYDLKHFREKIWCNSELRESYELLENLNREYIRDSASVSISFDLTAEQVRKLEIYLKQENSKLSAEWYMHFNFYILFSNNCANFAGNVYKKLFNDGHLGDYLTSENLDFYDKGVLYTFISSYPSKALTFFSEIADGLSHMAFDVSYSKILNNMLLGWKGSYISGAFDNISEALYETFNPNKIYKLLNDVFLKAGSYLSNKDVQYFLYSKTGNHKNAYYETFYGNTKVHVAAYNEDLYYFDQLSEKELFIINAPNQFDDTPLHIAVKRSCKTALKLLEKEANPNSLNKEGYTPLHNAVSSHWSNEEKYELVEALLKHGANPNIVEVSGESNVLFEAIKSNCSVKLFELILNYCNNSENILADSYVNNKLNVGINFTNNQGKNLAHIAVEKKNEQIKFFLKQNYPELFKQGSIGGKTPEEYEAEMESWDNGFLKYPYEYIKFPFKYNQLHHESLKKKNVKPQYSKQDFTFSQIDDEIYCPRENIYDEFVIWLQ